MVTPKIVIVCLQENVVENNTRLAEVGNLSNRLHVKIWTIKTGTIKIRTTKIHYQKYEKIIGGVLSPKIGSGTVKISNFYHHNWEIKNPDRDYKTHDYQDSGPKIRKKTLEESQLATPKMGSRTVKIFIIKIVP